MSNLDSIGMSKSSVNEASVKNLFKSVSNSNTNVTVKQISKQITHICFNDTNLQKVISY